MVGATSAFRRYSDKDYARAYKSYTSFVSRWEDGIESLTSAEEFRAEFSGYTKLRLWRVFGVASDYQAALVPTPFVDQVEFASKANTFLWQAAEDLVAAETNHDGVIVITAVLCDRDSEFTTCRKSYRTGLFDAVTGLQVNGRLENKARAVRIDLNSYKVIDE